MVCEGGSKSLPGSGWRQEFLASSGGVGVGVLDGLGWGLGLEFLPGYGWPLEFSTDWGGVWGWSSRQAMVGL